VSIATAALLISTASWIGAQSAAEPDDPPSRAARIGALSGTVSFQPSGAETWSDAILNYTLTTGSRLYTGGGSRAELDIGSLAIRLSESVDFIMTNLTDHLVQIGVASGTVRLSVYRLPAGDTIEVDTPNGALMIDAPGQYRVDVVPSDNSTVVMVERGRLDATGPGTSQAVAAGQVVRLSGTDPVVVSTAARPLLTSFDAWSSSRDQRLAALPASQYVNPDIPGCADLYQYGRWGTEASYGVVWFPGVAPGWIPYRDGHWAWIEPWGWVWVENEPWGYAPFHYGRWVLIRGGWAWIPGPYSVRPYYAPALVVFFGGRGFSIAMGIEVQGWFPLGPREPFFPWYHHRPGYLHAVNAAGLRDVTDIDALLHGTDFASRHYANRDAALTVVKASVFNTGSPVGPSVMHTVPQQALHGEIIVHPATVPAPIAEFGGRGPTKPPVASRPPMTVAKPRAAPSGQPTPPTRVGPPPRVTPAPPIPNAPPRVTPAPPVPNAPPRVTPAPPTPKATPPARGATTRPQVTVPQRPLIVRSPPVAQNPPFPAREKGMEQYPGRPLEPHQIQDIRAGRPVSAPRDPQPPASAPANPKPPASAPANPKAQPKKPPKGRG
jgi:hypothetical protein